MLLALDVGNLTMSVGLFDKGGTLQFLAVLNTDKAKTADQIAVDLMNLFQLYHYDLSVVSGAIFCSVVPPMDFGIEKALTRLLGKPPLRVGPGVKTGLNIRTSIHTQLGVDLVSGAVAAVNRYEPPIIMIVMGTATAFCYITEKKSFEGGLLFPGVTVSLEALSKRTAQLPDVSFAKPVSLIGKTTEDCMQSGIVYGTAGMLDGVIDRIRALTEKPTTVVATGPNAPVIVRYCNNDIIYDKNLVMDGLYQIYRKNAQ
jgi:type III pantothenate kinase